MSLEEIERAGARHIEGLAATVRQLWAKACQHDGIPADAGVVVFSKDNPYVPFHDKAMRELQEARAAFVPGGGYVGLRIENGRATLPRKEVRHGRGHTRGRYAGEQGPSEG